ncbi:hypothetical protein L0Y65_05015 [Candidatus Micrarchaeota archaeon]|nr:hypothetical protein [Candidatus Micrarchaeota archaeon]
MALNLLGDFFSFINIPMFDAMTVILIASFIVWEAPRTVKLLSEEYTKGLYPENGRVIDVAMFAVGLASVVFFMLDNNAERIVTFLKTPGVTAFFLVLMLAIPLIVAMGFFKRMFARFDEHNSITIFLSHTFLDLMHTLFHIALTVLFLPIVGYFALGPR